MRWSTLAAAVVAAWLLVCIPANSEEPAEFKAGGSFAGGKSTDGMVLSGIRFGRHTGYTRMVLDFEFAGGGQTAQHPVYEVAYLEFPYRLSIRLQGVTFSSDSVVQAKPALPFSVVTELNGTVREMQIYLSGPSEFKVIEIDNPAKLSIDVRRLEQAVPDIFTVQLLAPQNAQEAYALLEQGNLPTGYNPSVLVLGEVVVVEQVFTDPSAAVAMESALKELGHSAVINQRRGDQLPSM